MADPLPITRVSHLELVVGNAKQAAYFYQRAFGFDQVAYLGPETGHPDRASYVLRQQRITLVLTTPLSHYDKDNVLLTVHGDTVRDIAFEVDDVDAVFTEAVRRGAIPAVDPVDLTDDSGKVRRAAVRTYGETIHSFVDRHLYDGPFLPGYAPREKPGRPVGLIRVDHVVGNVEDRQMERWVRFYTDVFGFDVFVSYDDKDISTEFSALRSTVVANKGRRIKFPLNEPADGRRKSQIQEYIDYNVTAGVQHAALHTSNIIDTVTKLRENGVEFLSVPDTYYDLIWDRVGAIAEDRDKIRELGILVDRDDKGYLLQIFTMPVQDRPTLFIEIIQRKGSDSFGKGNFKALFESIERQQAQRGNL